MLVKYNYIKDPSIAVQQFNTYSSIDNSSTTKKIASCVLVKSISDMKRRGAIVNCLLLRRLTLSTTRHFRTATICSLLFYLRLLYGTVIWWESCCELYSICGNRITIGYRQDRNSLEWILTFGSEFQAAASWHRRIEWRVFRKIPFSLGLMSRRRKWRYVIYLQ